MIKPMLFALVVTVISEIIFVRGYGYKNKLDMATFTLINFITNPSLNLVIYFSGYLAYFFKFGTLLILAGLEFIVVIIEWMLLRFIYKDNSKSLFFISLNMNIFSVLIGILITLIYYAIKWKLNP